MATEVLSAEPDHSGRAVGNWRLVRPLGVGGFGAVYEAAHGSIPGRRGAVKILHAQMALNADIKRRFINEASAASRAEHENIVQIFDGGVTEDGLCYVVMELLSGRSLAAVLREGPLPAPRALNIAAQVAAALAVAHGLGIVHRDLKPDNIFIVPRDANPEFVKVLDFGIAKLEDGTGKTQTGLWLGTPAYMAPEQWQTLPDIDGRADLYALGVILFQCLSGALPFSGTTPYEWLTAHLEHPVPDLLGVAAPPEVLGLVRRLLAKRREERPQSATAVVQELRGGGARDASLPVTVMGTAAPPGANPAAARRRVAPVLALGLFGALLGAGLWWYARSHRTAPGADAVATAPQVAASPDLASSAAPVAASPDLASSAALVAAAPDLASAAAPVAAAADLAPAAAPLEVAQAAEPATAPRQGTGARKRAASKRGPASKAITPPPEAPKAAPPADPEKPGDSSGRRKHEPIY